MKGQREWILQGNYGYGHGWEDLCAEEFRTEINQRLKEYQENEGGTYRVITRKVIKKFDNCHSEQYRK